MRERDQWTGTALVQELGAHGERQADGHIAIDLPVSTLRDEPASIVVSESGGAVLFETGFGDCSFVVFDSEGVGVLQATIGEYVFCGGLRATPTGYDALLAGNGSSMDAVMTDTSVSPAGSPGSDRIVDFLYADPPEETDFARVATPTGSTAAVISIGRDDSRFLIGRTSGPIRVYPGVAMARQPPPPARVQTDRGYLFVWQPPLEVGGPMQRELLNEQAHVVIATESMDTMASAAENVELANVGGHVLLVWIADAGSANESVLVRLLDATGSPLTPPTVVGTFLAARHPRVVETTSGAVIVFEAADRMTSGTYQLFSVALRCP